jgi:hypothetical protein
MPPVRSGTSGGCAIQLIRSTKNCIQIISNLGGKIKVFRLRDHPVVEQIERTGYPAALEDERPLCPMCGQEIDFFITDIYNDVKGCTNCLKTRSWKEWWDLA